MKTLGIIAAGFLLVAASLGPVYAQSGVITATVRPNPLEISVSAPGSVTVGQWFDISAEIANLSDDPITRTIVILNSPPEIKIKAPRKKIGNLNAHQTVTVNWQAKANSAGNFVIQVEAEGNLDGEQISSSDSTVVSVVESFAFFLFRLINGA